MGSGLISFILAAGVAAFIYSKMGQRIGYSNGKQVWTLVAAVFVLVFIAAFILFKTLGF